VLRIACIRQPFEDGCFLVLCAAAVAVSDSEIGRAAVKALEEWRGKK
jgi:hypothetical protein